jgi:hypothetical protein
MEYHRSPAVPRFQSSRGGLLCVSTVVGAPIPPPPLFH